MNSRGAAAGGGAGIQNMQNIQGGIGAVSIGDREAAMLAQQSQYDNIGHHLHHHGAGRDPHGPPAPSTPQGFHRTLSQPQGGPSPSLSAKSKLSQVSFVEIVSPKIQQTKMLVTYQRFGDLFLFGLVWQYSSVQTKYNKGTELPLGFQIWVG